jgi:uncharacterized protein
MGELARDLRKSGHVGGALRRATYRTLKRPFFGRFMKPWRWPEGIDSGDYERVEVDNESGVRLQVLRRRCADARPRGVVVFAHPMGFAAKGFWLKHGHAQQFVERGWHVLVFDFNGFGESAHGNFDYPADAIAVGRFARQDFPGLPVVLVGASFGAMRGLETVAREPRLFDALVAEAAAPTLPDFWKHYPAAQLVLQASRLVYPRWERELRPEHVLQRPPNLPPILLVHSRTDRWTPPEFGDRIERAVGSRGQVSRLVVDCAEHTHALRDAPAAYLTAVFDFLDGLPAVQSDNDIQEKQ